VENVGLFHNCQTSAATLISVRFRACEDSTRDDDERICAIRLIGQPQLKLLDILRLYPDDCHVVSFLRPVAAFSVSVWRVLAPKNGE
jgi:hypothetical protein